MNWEKIKKILPKILLFYSLFITLLILIGGISLARSGKDIFQVVIILPVAIYLSWQFYQAVKK